MGLALLLTDGVESLSSYVGTKISAILFATLGNATELILTIIALFAGHVVLVKAAVMGAVLGNLLVVPGLAMLFGGIKHGRQHFNTQDVAQSTTMMLLSIAGFLIPTIFAFVDLSQNHTLATEAPSADPSLFPLSIGVAVILLIVYALGLFFSLLTDPSQKGKGKPEWSLPATIGILLVSTILTGFLSDFMVNAVEELVKNFHFSEIFLGVILLPLIGDVPEHIVGIQQGINNKMHLALAISMESAAQIVMFVAPILVLVSLFLPTHLNFYFEPLEILVLGLGVFVAMQVTNDGESNWLEGVQLLAIYVLAGIGFFLL